MTYLEKLELLEHTKMRHISLILSKSTNIAEFTEILVCEATIAKYLLLTEQPTKIKISNILLHMSYTTSIMEKIEEMMYGLSIIPNQLNTDTCFKITSTYLKYIQHLFTFFDKQIRNVTNCHVENETIRYKTSTRPNLSYFIKQFQTCKLMFAHLTMSIRHIQLEMKTVQSTTTGLSDSLRWCYVNITGFISEFTKYYGKELPKTKETTRIPDPAAEQRISADYDIVAELEQILADIPKTSSSSDVDFDIDAFLDGVVKVPTKIHSNSATPPTLNLLDDFDILFEESNKSTGNGNRSENGKFKSKRRYLDQ
jgi:hypothetical protein